MTASFFCSLLLKLELWFSQKICAFTKISVMCEGTLLVCYLLLNFLEISMLFLKKKGDKNI